MAEPTINNGQPDNINVDLANLVREGSVVRTPFRPHKAATSHRYEGIQDMEDTTIWQKCMTTKALADIPFDEYLGLKFYHVDPLPVLLQYMRELPNQSKTNQRFVDHEFPTQPSVSVTVDTCTHRGGTIRNMLPGVITSSNCRDFAGAEAKRSKRIHRFCELASTCSWKRMGSATSLFMASEADSITQGSIGNCGFCSAFSSLVQGWPNLIHEAFGRYSREALFTCGAYSLQLFPQGKQRYILLDEYLLRKKASNNAPSIHSEYGDTWVEYLEKAIVKIQGTYASLDGHYKHNSLYRHPARALQLLTGAAIALEVNYNVVSQANSLEEVYEMLMASEGRYARVAHCRAAHKGLFSNHGYSLLWIGTTSTNQQLVCLRNPHGARSYKGKYGYDWDWKGRDGFVKEELMNLDVFGRLTLGCPGKGGDNGIFLMEFSVFARCFPIVTIVGPIDSLGSSHKVHSAHGTAWSECMHKSKPESLCLVRRLLETAASKRRNEGGSTLEG